MSMIKRVQLVIQTQEGSLLTSIQLPFEGAKVEFVTMASVRYLFGGGNLPDENVVRNMKLITYSKDGINYATCESLLPHLRLTSE